MLSLATSEDGALVPNVGSLVGLEIDVRELASPNSFFLVSREDLILFYNITILVFENSMPTL